MDLDGFRSFLLDSGIDVWTWIDMAISVASTDHEDELRKRRDGIIQKLYAPSFPKCGNCNQLRRDLGLDCEIQGGQSRNHLSGIKEGEEDDEDQRKILEIRVLLDDKNQNERTLTDLLQMLVDMDTSFKALKETDIGRHVTKLRKHSSGEVRRLVKILVRKWKDIVDEWVRLNTPPEETIDDKKSPQVEAHMDHLKGNLRQNQNHGDSDKQGSGALCLTIYLIIKDLNYNPIFPIILQPRNKEQQTSIPAVQFQSNNGEPTIKSFSTNWVTNISYGVCESQTSLQESGSELKVVLHPK